MSTKRMGTAHEQAAGVCADDQLVDAIQVHVELACAHHRVEAARQAHYKQRTNGAELQHPPEHSVARLWLAAAETDQTAQSDPSRKSLKAVRSFGCGQSLLLRHSCAAAVAL